MNHGGTEDTEKNDRQFVLQEEAEEAENYDRNCLCYVCYLLFKRIPLRALRVSVVNTVTEK